MVLLYSSLHRAQINLPVPGALSVSTDFFPPLAPTSSQRRTPVFESPQVVKWVEKEERVP